MKEEAERAARVAGRLHARAHFDAVSIDSAIPRSLAMETKPCRSPSDAIAQPRYRDLRVHDWRAPGAKSMRMERLIAAAAFAVAAFVAVPTAEAIAQSTSVETQSSIKNCRYY